MAMTDIDDDLKRYATSSLLRELKCRNEMPLNKLNFEEFIEDCWCAFEKRNRSEFNYLMCKLKDETES